jgi:uncharacterized damage-inducible protein DinB
LRTTEEHTAIVIVRWIMLAPGSAAIASLWPMLDASEQARADRFHMATDRDAYIFAHALLRTTLSGMAGIAAKDLRFRTAKNGKPALDGSQSLPDLHFSLSHTRGLAARMNSASMQRLGACRHRSSLPHAISHQARHCLSPSGNRKTSPRPSSDCGR